MYSVHAVVHTTGNNNSASSEIIIHDNMSPVNELHLIDPKLKIADTSAGTFTATILPTNPGYSLIERFTSTIKVFKEKKLIWTGRVLSESIDFWNRRSISCEGALAYLNDTVQPIAYYGPGKTPAYILQTLLSIHNSKVDNDRKLYFGSVDELIEYAGIEYVFQTDNRTTWEELKFNILDRYDCHLDVTYSNGRPFVNIYYGYPNTAVQQINFGENLLDFTRNWNLIDITTVILPRGAQLDEDTSDGQQAYITLKTSNEDSTAIDDGTYSIGSHSNIITVDGQYVINNELYSRHGRVEQVIDFSDAQTANELFNCAKGYLLGMQFDELVLKVSAVDLHALTNEIVSFNLLDEVYCISIPHGMYGKYFPISEIDIPLDKPENTTYTMTRSSTSYGLTGNFTSFKSSIGSSFKNITSPGHILDLAKINASSIINRKTTGYVSVVNMFDSEEEGVAQAVVISNNPEWKKASKYWIWNMNGLAYYSATRSKQIASSVVVDEEDESNVTLPAYTEQDGNNFEAPRYYDLAITMDGTIVANHIKSGILSDGMGYNFWNLETGEFSLQPNTKMYYGGGSNDYRSIFDMIYDTDKAINKRTGSANHLNGTADWAEWRRAGNWTLEGEEAICASKTSATNSDTLISPARQLKYSAVKGYTMTFSLEGASADQWGNMSSSNAFIVSVEIVNSSNNVQGRCEKAFVFEPDYTRRFTTFNMINSTFGLSDDTSSYDSYYVDIRLINRSTHNIAIRRPQFERGNTPTDWAISDADADKEAMNKATNAYNASITAAASMDQEIQRSVTSEAQHLSQKALTDANKFTSRISTEDRTYSDGILAAFDRSMTQREVLKRLTNNFSNSGIYLNDGELLINADYIRTGSLEAGILTAGVIHDRYDNCKWNLTNGYFETRNGVFINSEVQGQMVCGTDSGSKIVLEDGAIKFYWNGNYIGSMSAVYSDGDRWVGIDARNIMLQADDEASMYAGNTVVVGNQEMNDHGDIKPFDIDYVSGVDSDGQGWVQPYKTRLHFEYSQRTGNIHNVWQESLGAD